MAPAVGQLVGVTVGGERVDVPPVAFARGVYRRRTAAVEAFDATHVREGQSEATVGVLLAGLARFSSGGTPLTLPTRPGAERRAGRSAEGQFTARDGRLLAWTSRIGIAAGQSAEACTAQSP